MSKRAGASILFTTCLLWFSCGRVDYGSELDALKVQQRKEQIAHLSNDVSQFDEIFGDTLCQIKNGQVSYLTNDQVITRFRDYFSSVSFKEWDDIKDPVYLISDDATLAHVLVQKHVELIANADSTRSIVRTDFAWTELWRKKNGQWMLYSITSTDNLLQ
jgi:hypothetical protein